MTIQLALSSDFSILIQNSNLRLTIVLGASGEAGIGAAASAEARAGVEDGVAFVEVGAKAGVGGILGGKLKFGFK